MLITVGGESIGVMGQVGAGLGVGIWVDTEKREAGPYLYVLGGGGWGVYGGSALEVGVYRDHAAFKGHALEIGMAGGEPLSYGGNASLDRWWLPEGLTGSVGVGSGVAAWILGSVTIAGKGHSFARIRRWARTLRPG
jgi:hypothetical protein